ncbi:MAG: hypothetical protein IKR39_06370 [Lachnospiraceae bacterium]|nr:hypothetical protein [Lachnospiraceae bacterium]
MGRRILAVLLSMVIVLAVFVKSDAINVYADDLGNKNEAITEEFVESEVKIDETTTILPEETAIVYEEEEPEEESEEIKLPDVSDSNPSNEAEEPESLEIAFFDVSDNSEVIETEESEAAEEESPFKIIEDLSGNDAGTVIAIEESQEPLAFLDVQPIEGLETSFVATRSLSLAGGMSLMSVGTGLVDAGDEEALVESMTVSLNGTVLDPSEEVVMSLNDTIKVHYTFRQPLVINPKGFTPNPTAFPGYQVVAGESYKVYGIPKICSKPGGLSIDVESGDRRLGVISIDEDGNAILTIDDTFTEVESAEDAYAGRELTLSLNKADNGDVDRYELTFAHNTYTVRIKEFMPQAPKVTKTASAIDSDGNVTWTVTVTNDEKPIAYEDGFTIKDTFSAGQAFLEGSLSEAASGAITPSVDGNTISWNYKDNTPSKVSVFTYKTHIDVMALVKDANADTTINKDVTNKVTITASGTDDYAPLSLTADAKSTISKDVDKWVDKTGTDVDSTGKATWTITVKNNGFTIKDVVLHDTIVADDDVTIEMTDIKVVDALGNDVSFTPSANGNEHEIAFTGNMSGEAVYTVTYNTTIKNYAEYLKKNHTVPSNSAWLTYSYDASGKGTEWTPVTGPGMEAHFKGPGMMAKAAVKKSSAGIDRVNHTMDWLVEVNSNEQALTGVSVTDAIPEGHIYAGIKNVKIDGADAVDSLYSVDDSNLTNVVVSFGDNIEGKKASFVIITKLTDSENMIWASNASKEYVNEVTLKSDGNAAVKDSAKQTYDSTVIAKTAGNYDYNTHLIPYTITVNQNKMAMNNVTVTDPLDSRLEYVADSSNVSGTIYNAGTNTLTFNLGNITDKTVITFYAKVKDGDTFANNGKITIPNSASLVSAEYGNKTEVSCSTTINNSVIRKKGVQNDEIINYTVEVNVAQQNLYRSGIGEVVIQDTMGASLVLDDESVKLYEATVNSDGTLTQGSLVTGAVVRIDCSNPRTVLEVVVPKSGSSKAYILKYTAKMLKKKAKEFTNNVLLKGYGDSLLNKSDVSYEEKHFSNVNFNKYVYYISGLKDEDDNSLIIAGAHFELIDPSKGNKIVAEADSDDDGEIMFVGNLEENHTYILKETDAPDGYEIPVSLQKGVEVTTKGKGYGVALAEKDNNTVYNAKYDPSKHPAPAPKPSSGSSSSGKVKTVEVLADEYDATLNRRRLAKTGGFMGTVAGYGTGVGLMLSGLYMVIGRKKKKK